MNERRDATLGLGIGWRPEIAVAIDRRDDLGFVELLAENYFDQPPPPAVHRLRERGVAVVPHGISLSLGGAEPIDPVRVAKLARLAERFNSPLVSEHLAFVRAGDLEAGHLLPTPRDRETLDIVVENILAAKKLLPVPIAIENIATLFDWPDAEMDDAEFLTEVLERADVPLLLDIENLYANAANRGHNAVDWLQRIPLERLAYVHVAGGAFSGGVYHDTHAHAVSREVLGLLADLCQRADVPGAMLERDDAFGSAAELYAELDAIMAVLNRSAADRPPAKLNTFESRTAADVVC